MAQPPVALPANPTPSGLEQRPTPRAVDRSYHPKGYGMSPSLQRARRPFFLRNVLVGSTIACFVAGVYIYSISAVQQDDFSDVEDLLPPLAERSQFKSIEDEARDTAQLRSVASAIPTRPKDTPARDTALPSFTSGARSLSKALPGEGAGSDVRAAVEGERRGDGVWERVGMGEWMMRRGWVEAGTGNVVVWGAPDVERVGRVGEGGVSRGPRVV